MTNLPSFSPAPSHGKLSAHFPIWLVAAVVLANAVLIGMGVQHLISSRERTVAAVKHNAANLSHLLSVNMADSARRIDLALLSIVDFLEHRVREGELHNAEVEELLRLHRQRNPEIAGLRLTNARGDALWGNGVDPNKPSNWTDREFFPRHRAQPGRELIVTEPIIGRVTASWVIAFTRSYRNPDGSFGGVVSASVPVRHFTDLLARTHLGSHGSAVIRHRNKALVTRFPAVAGAGGQTGDRTVSGEFAALLASGKEEGFFHTKKAPDGYERTYASRRVGPLPYYLNVGMAPQDYFGEWHEEVRNTTLTLLAFLLGSVASAWWIGRAWQQRARDNARLQRNEERFRIVSSITSDLIYACHRGEDGLFRISWAGGNALAIFGIEIEDLLQMGCWRPFVEPEDLPLFAVGITYLQPGQSSDQLLRVRHRDGALRYLRSIAHVVTPEDGVAADLHMLYGALQDVSERQMAAAELEQHRNHLEVMVVQRTEELALARDAAEAASRAKSTFLANMSYELRTPMNGIIGMTNLVQRRTQDPLLLDQLGKISQASGRLLALINDILDISKIEAERLVLEQVDFSLGEVLDNLMNLVGPKVMEKGLKIHIDLAPQLPSLLLNGDPLRMGQILLNLAGNAVKFTETGAITLSARLQQDEVDQVVLRWEVQDTGIGIDSEDQKRLFTAFEQADGSMTRKYGGTGLGLAISKRLAHLMGGEIGVESRAGEGSTFWFTTRLRKASASEATTPEGFTAISAESRIATHYAGTSVLLVEDEPINQEVSHSLLEDAGLRVDLAEDGNIALAMARRHVYALILMDMQMPNLNGVDATRAIRADSLNTTTPILAMTANAFEEDRKICLAAGMNDHIAKPIEPELLFERLWKWLQAGQ